MSNFTTQVRYACESLAGYRTSQDLSKILGGTNPVLSDTNIPKILPFLCTGSGAVPVFKEEYRLPLLRKILLHYYTREIGFETVGLWQMKMGVKFGEIMPYYNQLYEHELAIKNINLFNDTDLQTIKGNNKIKTGKSEQESNENNIAYSKSTGDTENISNDVNSNTSKQYFSDTPQDNLSGVESGKYLTSFTKQTDESVGNGSNKQKSNQDVNTNNSNNLTNNIKTNEQEQESIIENIVGKQGGESNAKLILDIRKTFMNIDEMVINEFEPMFMGIWE